MNTNTNVNENENKYPHDIFKAITKTRAFSIEAHLTKDMEISPLMIFHDSFSRFVFVAADLTKEKDKAAICNIHISDIPGIVKKTDYAFNKYLDNMNIQISASDTDGENNSTSIAYTRRFTTGNLKGKSPAEVLVENGEAGKDILNKQYLWLKENLSKYPKNQELMDAIVEAGKLDLSKISENVPTASAPINIFDLSTRPLIRKKREDGKCFCYESKIDYIPGNKYPIVITVENYYAPVKENTNGTLNVQLSSKDNNSVINRQIFLSFEDWLFAVEQMSSTIDNFKKMHFAEAMKASNNISMQQRESIDSKKQNEIISIEVKTNGPVNGLQIPVIDNNENKAVLIFDKEGKDSLGKNWDYLVENAPTKQILLKIKAEKRADNLYRFIQREA